MIDIIQNLLITLALGTFIGLQFRKSAEEGNYKDNTFAGLRTCMATTLIGYLAVFLSKYESSILILSSAFIFILILLSYVQSAFQDKRIGGTSEISLGLLFLIGVLVGYEESNMAIIATILLSIISSGRTSLYNISDKFTRLELIETVKFAIIIFMILPLLPNQTIDPWGVINPYNIWLMVILISGISFIGYMASKFIGTDRSILLTGLVGGAVSSTAVTTTMAIESKKKPRYTNLYALAILLASLTMYLRVLIEAIIINQNLLRILIIPIGAMLITMIAFTLFSFTFHKPSNAPKLKKDVSGETPFSLKPALKFSLFFVVILFLIRFTEMYLGNKGIYLTSIISSLADVDAITISLSQLSGTQDISEILAIRGITLAVIGNTFMKIIYVSFFGPKELSKKMIAVFSLTALVGIATSFMI